LTSPGHNTAVHRSGMASRARPDSDALHERALDDLRYIRETMTHASSFTAISGIGVLVVGAGAIVTACVTSTLDGALPPVAAWLVDAACSVAIGLATTARKARTTGQPLWSGPFRKFALGFAPAIVAGALLTLALLAHGEYALLPALWLLLYGAGLVAGGAFSVPIVPAMGAAFMVVGVFAAFGPETWNPWYMIAGFGVLHLVFGAILVRRYGG
jgi:hypothetical protein